MAVDFISIPAVLRTAIVSTPLFHAYPVGRRYRVGGLTGVPDNSLTVRLATVSEISLRNA